MLRLRSGGLPSGMTPVEVGLWGAALVFFGGSFFLAGKSTPLWGGLLLVTLMGSFLTLGVGNFFLLNWAPPGGAHTSMVGITPGGFYEVGHLEGSFALGDFKFLSLLLLGVAVVCFMATPVGGYEPLLIGLVAVLAGLLTFSVDNLILLYLALELQALALYTLVGYFKFEEERTDSALKYLLSGSLVSGFMLLGFARWYGLNGGFHLGDSPGGYDPIGSAWVLGVLLFKVGVVPFHFWTPLAYTPLDWGTLGVTLGATKVNIWYLLVRNLSEFTHQGWWILWWTGLTSVVVGSIGGYFQTGVGGLLAYSGVINGGYLLLLSLTTPVDGGFSFGYYAGVYLLGTLGVVSLASIWGDTRVTGFAVWGKLGVGIPLVLYYLCLSLGGLPVFPGFFAKLILLQGLGGFGFFFLSFLVVASVVPAVYYVSLAAGSLFTPSEEEVNPPGGVSPGGAAYLVVGFNGGVNFLIGVM